VSLGGDAAEVFRCQGISRVYGGAGPAVTALQPVDLVVARGAHLAVVGPSGSGKSTLLNLLGLLDRPSTGELYVDGVPTSRLRAADRTRLRAEVVGFVFQAFHLLAGRSVLDNVAMGLLYSGTPRRRRLSRAAEVLDRVGLSHRLDADPVTLSGGERQRVAIARAVSADARVLLCDEPTGNLDQANGQSVMALLRELHADGTTVVTVTHDRTVAAQAQTVLDMADGRVVHRSERLVP